MNIEGSKGTARIVVGSCSSGFHDRRRRSKGARAVSIETNTFADEDASIGDVLRRFGTIGDDDDDDDDITVKETSTGSSN
jgi:hypothetical protein